MVCDGEADGYRLPSEAEWEFTCRAGRVEARYGDLDAIAWYRGNSQGELHNVALRAPNAWGFHDMIGNVWEWCWDVYDPRVYGPYRVFRGGGFFDEPRGCRVSCRRKSRPTLAIKPRVPARPFPVSAAQRTAARVRDRVLGARRDRRAATVAHRHRQAPSWTTPRR